jgi:hypothetical protein
MGRSGALRGEVGRGVVVGASEDAAGIEEVKADERASELPLPSDHRGQAAQATLNHNAHIL